MKNSRIKFLAFLMTLTMLLATLVLPVQAVVFAIDTNTAADTALTLNDIGGRAGLGASAVYSTYGTPTIDGTFDAAYGSEDKPVAKRTDPKDISTLSALTKSKNGGEDFSIWYVNDSTYLYFYLKVTLPTDRTQLIDTDLTRLYIDFYNQHKKAYNVANNEYMNAYLKDNTTNNGGQFQYNLMAETAVGSRGASNAIGKYGTDSKYFFLYKGETELSTDGTQTSKDLDGYVIEARVKLPTYVQTAIKDGEEPVISIGYEIRANNNQSGIEPATIYKMSYVDSSLNLFSLVYGDYTIAPDVVLAKGSDPDYKYTISNANGTNMQLDGEMKDDEGWSDIPFSIMTSASTSTGTGVTAVEDHPHTYIAADADYMYVFVDAKDRAIFRYWFILQLDPDIGGTTATDHANTYKWDRYLQLNYYGTNKEYYSNPGGYSRQNKGNDCFSIQPHKTNDDAFYGKDATQYKFAGTQCVENDATTPTAIEFRIPMTDYMKELVLNGTSFKIGSIIAIDNNPTEKTPTTSDSVAALDDHHRCQDPNYKFGWSNGVQPVTIHASYLIDRTVADVNDKVVTVDGVKDASEGWATKPYDVLTNNLQKAGLHNVKDDPFVYLSADSDNLYAFYDAHGAKMYVVYLIIQFDTSVTKGANAYDKFISMRIRGTATGASWADQCTWRDGDGGDYLLDDKAHPFDNTQYGFNTDKSTIEFKVPLPEWVKEELNKGDLDIKVGFDVRFDMDADNTYDVDRVSGEYGLAWVSGVVPVTLKKVDSDAIVTVEGVQSRKADAEGTDVRFVAALNADYTLFDEVGFEFSYVKGDETVVAPLVYSSKLYKKLTSGDGYAVAGEGDYADATAFFCYTAGNMADGTYTISIKAFTSTTDSDVKIFTYSTTITLTVANGVITVA